ncbi:MAG: metallo-beta-lactamase [Peptococcaceae bacterium BRH_c8a]|nr:MAG: metallo-beta-lactamase [Peptococcaceae bacterium BRH_c8a]
MQITFLGAAQTVTGSCHLVETADKKIMVDCGMFQGPRVIRERNYEPFAVTPQSVDYLLLTHAHIDHSGQIPRLFKHGFEGRALATDASVDLLEVMLPDSGHIQEMEVERLNRKARRAGKKLFTPIYTAEDGYECVKNFERVRYNQIIALDEDISVRFVDAGHILGSSILEMWIREGGNTTKLVFTGDLGSPGKPYVHDPTIIEEADYLVIESTYGNRLHKDNDQNRSDKLAEVIKETYQKGGNLIIPAFAVERTQDLLYDINQLVLADKLPPVKVYIDSPMAVAVTEVFRRHPELFDIETSKLIMAGENPLTMPELHFSRTTDESRMLNALPGGAIILSASGMCDAGRIKHHLKHNLWRPECTVLFVGYQAPGTKGHHLLNGATSIRIHGEEVAVKADIRRIDAYSSHADQQGLLDWVSKFKNKPRRVFLVHGEPEGMKTMAGLMQEKLGLEAYAPQWQETVNLTPGAVLTTEDLLSAYQEIAVKMEIFASSAPARSELERVMKRIREINGILDKTSQAG